MGFLQGNCFESEPERVVREAEQVTLVAAHPNGIAQFRLDTFMGAYDPEFAAAASKFYRDAANSYPMTETEQQLAEWNLRGEVPPMEDK